MLAATYQGAGGEEGGAIDGEDGHGSGGGGGVVMFARGSGG